MKRLEIIANSNWLYQTLYNVGVPWSNSLIIITDANKDATLVSYTARPSYYIVNSVIRVVRRTLSLPSFLIPYRLIMYFL